MSQAKAMEQLNRLASTFSNSVSSTLFSTVSTIKDVLPGNNVTKEFEASEHCASAGPGLLWKVYNGCKKSTRQAASVFVFEKRQLERFDRADRDLILDTFRKSVAQLTRLRHPQVLIVQHPLEESRDCLAFATEPVFASLANIMGRTENMPSPVPHALRDYKLFDVEIKYGLMQLSEGLAFLHEGVKMVHRNLSPESVVVNAQGAWKIFGFDFCVANSAPANQTPAWSFPEHVHGAPPETCPDLDFLAPEYALSGACSPASDMYSLGMLAFAMYNSKPLFCNGSSWATFKRNAAELKSLRESNLQLIPAELRDYLKMMLSASPDLRPDAAQFSKIEYFNDVGVKTLNNLDSQFQWDNLQKSQFYKSLPSILPRLPHRVALHRVVPCLAKEYVNAQMVPFVLPTVLQIAEEASKEDFAKHVLPELKTVMKIVEPVQVLLIFMQRMELLLTKTPPSDVKSDVLPMIYRALEQDTSQIQELCLSIIPGFAGLMDYQAMKTALLPRIKKLCVSTNLLSVRVNCLICLGKLLAHLDKWQVIDEILPMLQTIPSREPAVIMGIVGIYKMTVSDEKLGLTKEVIASKVLPFLIPLSIENGLSLNQYNIITGLIRQMLTKIEDEHRVKLEQLGAINDEQRSALQVSMSESAQRKPGELVSVPAGCDSDMDSMFAGLGLGSYVQKKDTGAIATGLMMTATPPPTLPSDARSTLSLEEKKRIMQQSESLKLQQQQPQLTPALAQPRPAATAARDLTQTLMDRNVGQMRSSQSMGFGGNGMSSQMSTMPVSSSNYSFGDSSWSGFVQAASPMQPQPQQRMAKPDLSAFDSLQALPSKPRQSLNAMGTPGLGMVPIAPMQTRPPVFGQQQQVKGLSSTDIDDLLS